MSHSSRPLTIANKYHLQDELRFELSTPHGWLETTLHKDTGRYLLENLQVTRQRQGIGKFLLQSSIEHAEMLRADYIEGFIISRECLDAMTTVFGKQYIEIAQVGAYQDAVYSDEDATSAHLNFALSELSQPSVYAKYFKLLQ